MGIATNDAQKSHVNVGAHPAGAGSPRPGECANTTCASSGAPSYLHKTSSSAAHSKPSTSHLEYAATCSISKVRVMPYRFGARSDWIKVKCPSWRERNRDRWRLFERP